MFPTPHTVTRIRRTPSGENALGQQIYSETSTLVAVYGWEPTSETERHTAVLAGQATTELKLLSPTDDFLPSDAVVINGVTYEVGGDVADYNSGPFGFTPGFVIGLRKVTYA